MSDPRIREGLRAELEASPLETLLRAVRDWVDEGKVAGPHLDWLAEAGEYYCFQSPLEKRLPALLSAAREEGRREGLREASEWLDHFGDQDWLVAEGIRAIGLPPPASWGGLEYDELLAWQAARRKRRPAVAGGGAEREEGYDSEGKVSDE